MTTFGYLKRFEELGGKAKRDERGYWSARWKMRTGEVALAATDETLLEQLRYAIRIMMSERKDG